MHNSLPCLGRHRVFRVFHHHLLRDRVFRVRDQPLVCRIQSRRHGSEKQGLVQRRGEEHLGHRVGISWQAHIRVVDLTGGVPWQAYLPLGEIDYAERLPRAVKSRRWQAVILANVVHLDLAPYLLDGERTHRERLLETLRAVRALHREPRPAGGYRQVGWAHAKVRGSAGSSASCRASPYPPVR
eukprot:scaffold14870_cov63-Phaeocystis_antarctica.AAC.2